MNNTAISYQVALERIAALANDELAMRRETCAVGAAWARVLAEDVRMARDQPPFDRATMDGFAVPVPDSAHDGRWQIIGAVSAGDPPVAPPRSGQALRIATGACVPEGCTVVPIEVTRCEGDVLIADAAAVLSQRKNVALRGEDARAGALIARRGALLTPAVLAACAMAGATSLAVYARPRITVLATGNEIDRSDATGIADSNGPMLAAAMQQLGATVTTQRCGDSLSSVTEAVRAALTSSDLLITSGGVSVGSKDFIAAALDQCAAQVLFHGVDIQPGKPVLVARHARTVILGLPGNPLGAWAGLHLFALPVLARLWPGFAWPTLRARLATPASSKARRLFLPVAWCADGVRVIAWNGSGDLLAAAHGDGLVELPPQAQWAAGTEIAFIPAIGAIPGLGACWPR